MPGASQLAFSIHCLAFLFLPFPCRCGVSSGRFGPLFDFRHPFAYGVSAVDEQKMTGALLIAASLIAAVRLRGEKIERTPRVMYEIAECVKLARWILAHIERA